MILQTIYSLHLLCVFISVHTQCIAIVMEKWITLADFITLRS